MYIKKILLLSQNQYFKQFRWNMLANEFYWVTIIKLIRKQGVQGDRVSLIYIFFKSQKINNPWTSVSAAVITKIRLYAIALFEKLRVDGVSLEKPESVWCIPPYTLCYSTDTNACNFIVHYNSQELSFYKIFCNTNITDVKTLVESFKN